MQKISRKNQKSKSVRLSTDVIPKEYFITLTPDLEAATFNGEVKIELLLKKPTKIITLHSKDLEILAVEMSAPKQSVQKIVYDEKKETVTFTFSQLIKKGSATLIIEFRGVLSDTMRGFYKSTYHIEGKEHLLATTQFEATDARRAIPSFDEPSMKAIFHIKLVVPINKTAISNTLPTEIVEHESGVKVISFAPTPKMSTYLLAFIVGDFEYIEKKTKRGVQVRVYTTPGKKEQGEFALDVAVKCLEFYEQYFAIPYPLKTLDMIAIPDFESGAMENWGAVTYRETALLIDKEHSATRAKQYVAIVVAHELAHQWFGNLVTMEWWTHLWLNEGFASYIEYLAVNALFPEWNMWEQFIVEDHNTALSLDALSNTHPIEVPVHHPGEITEIFDKISYSKGASIIRMLAEYLGKKDFRDGLRYYLKKHSYQNTETVHLWEAFEKVSGKPIQKMMHTWTHEPGFPLITVQEKKDAIVLSQSRFIISGKKSGETRWMIPYRIRTDRNKTDLLFSGKSLKIKKTNILWWKGNAEESSFSITKYDSYDHLSIPVKNKRLSAIDRLGILRDLHFLIKKGEVSAVTALQFLENYREESEYIVWVELANVMSSLRRLLYKTSVWEVYVHYIRTIIEPSLRKCGLEKKTNDTHTDILLRSLLLNLGSLYEIPEVIKYAKQLFAVRQKNPIDPNQRGFVYVTIARTNDPKIQKLFIALHQKEELQEEKNRILSALCTFSDKKLVQETFSFMKKEVRPQDQFRAYSILLHNLDTQEFTWEQMKKDWNMLLKQFERTHTLAHIIEGLEDLQIKNAYTSVATFFKANPVLSAKRTIRQVLETIAFNENFKKRNQKEVAEWLKKNSKK